MKHLLKVMYSNLKSKLWRLYCWLMWLPHWKEAKQSLKEVQKLKEDELEGWRANNLTASKRVKHYVGNYKSVAVASDTLTTDRAKKGDKK